MKKKTILLLSLAAVLSVTIGGICACAQKRPGQAGPSGVSDVLEQGMAEADEKTAESGRAGKPEESSTAPAAYDTEIQTDSASEPDYGPGKIDVDLTILSSTMVYSEVYDMMMDPEKYIGKTVKMQGSCAFYRDETSGNEYYACVIQDATACCAQGIEFVLSENYRPEDYPKEEDEICVAGVFDIYEEGGYTYCTLRNAKLMS